MNYASKIKREEARLEGLSEARRLNIRLRESLQRRVRVAGRKGELSTRAGFIQAIKDLENEQRAREDEIQKVTQVIHEMKQAQKASIEPRKLQVAKALQRTTKKRAKDRPQDNIAGVTEAHDQTGPLGGKYSGYEFVMDGHLMSVNVYDLGEVQPNSVWTQDVTIDWGY